MLEEKESRRNPLVNLKENRLLRRVDTFPKQVLEEINKDESRPKPFFCGVTGSGKTEVYMQAIAKHAEGLAILSWCLK